MTTISLNTIDLDQLAIWLKTRLTKALPGRAAQLLMAPPLREERMTIPEGVTAIDSAVLIGLVTQDQEPSIILIKRPEYDGVHSGQMAFPGGKREKEDSSEWETAKRESFEEVGLPLHSPKYLGSMTPLFIPHSGYIVRPVVAHINEFPPLKPDNNEVASIHIIKLRDLLDPSQRETLTFSTLSGEIKAPCYSVSKQAIWGATAMILSEFLVIVCEYLGIDVKTIFPESRL